MDNVTAAIPRKLEEMGMGAESGTADRVGRSHEVGRVGPGGHGARAPALGPRNAGPNERSKTKIDEKPNNGTCERADSKRAHLPEPFSHD